MASAQSFGGEIQIQKFGGESIRWFSASNAWMGPWQKGKCSNDALTSLAENAIELWY